MIPTTKILLPQIFHINTFENNDILEYHKSYIFNTDKIYLQTY